jgi:16S rRNA (guanine966-N2)-methyltransferase
MRVVAGIAGGRRLQGPVGDVIRPTTDKVREAVFNSLNSLEAIDGARVLDLFAGTGACGIEALSRGAASVTFVDRDRKALDVIRENLSTTGLEGDVVGSDAFAFLDRSHDFDVAFVDPPYEFQEWPRLLAALHASLAVCESNRPVEAPDGWLDIRGRKYGTTAITILKRERV